MIASDRHRVLFVHVQKTGGLTVESSMLERVEDARIVRGLAEGRHAKLGAALREYPELADYWTFGFVRNPWARMYSWWAMIRRREELAEAGEEYFVERVQRNPFWRGVLDRYREFEQFVMEAPEEFRRLRTPQVNYLRTSGKEADHVGRTESLAEDLTVVFERLELDLGDVPLRNQGPRTDHRKHYTPAMRDRVGELFAADVRAYDYEF